MSGCDDSESPLLVDSGCSTTLICDRSAFIPGSYRHVCKATLQAANGQPLSVLGLGDVALETTTLGRRNKIVLTGVYHVPSLPGYELLLVGQLCATSGIV
jgi:hypothetical protein